MEVLIAILVAAGIFNTLFVSVMERLREFGIMMAIGFSPGRLFRLVMWESLWLALIGMVLGRGGDRLALPLPVDHGNRHVGDGLVRPGHGDRRRGRHRPVMKFGIYPESLICHHRRGGDRPVLLVGPLPGLEAGPVEPVETIKLV